MVNDGCKEVEGWWTDDGDGGESRWLKDGV